jgi:CYTH domain-containing protein
MDIDPAIARSLGFPKPAYTVVERERRWVCREVPRERILRTETIVDLYVAGTRFRLREARPHNGDPAALRLSRKADIDSRTRLVTSIYLPEHEFAILSAALQGVRIRKIRHRLKPPPGVVLSVDEFKGELEGLRMVEAEFDTPERMASFTVPDFAIREVTDDPRFAGGYLATNGLPQDRVA